MSHEFNVNLGKRLGEAMAAGAVFAAGALLQAEVKKRLKSEKKQG